MDVQAAKDDLRQHYAVSRAALMSAIEGLSEADMSQAALDGWSVKDHLTHVTVWDEIRASEIERISGGFEPAWRHMTDRELHDIAAYLKRGVKPVSNRVQDSDGPPDFWAGLYTLDRIGPYPASPFPTSNEVARPPR